jgi:hypothetical protein
MKEAMYAVGGWGGAQAYATAYASAYATRRCTLSADVTAHRHTLPHTLLIRYAYAAGGAVRRRRMGRHAGEPLRFKEP